MPYCGWAPASGFAGSTPICGRIWFRPKKDPVFLRQWPVPAIVGIQYTLLKPHYAVAGLLWGLAGALWLILIYAFIGIRIGRQAKAAETDELDGSWLLLVVATQSVAILGTLIEGQRGVTSLRLLFCTLAVYLLGLMLYVLLTTLIVYRLLVVPPSAAAFRAPYWILMGSGAISTLAGATLLLTLRHVAPLEPFLPFLTGSSLLTWAVSSWWIPLLTGLTIWHYAASPAGRAYQASDWSLVFCLGMYTVCSWRLADALRLPFLRSVAEGFIWLALGAWLLTFLRMSASWRRWQP